ncbi:M56 family metallopeptidase [Pseudoflavitalea rhizosphaerae]|uniref:M56 family metallopeptidase n=1 Tax=Pseudoflavitalea rhizosphaerae TaxID=1884793 RepID=UPI000F8D20B7|nr:M56 family metallopeptidase [Pseudoflavitalea rhizosphaerae]
MDFILKLSIGLAVTWFFYWLLLRRLTFYRWNRLFLLVYPAMAFLVPFIDITGLLHQGDDKAWLRAIPVLEQYSYRFELQESSVWSDPVFIGGLVLAAGSIIMAARLCWQYWSLRKAVSGAVLLADDEARLYHVDKRIVPFSFGRSIYLNKHLHTEAELREILRHEFIHVKQRHSLDMMWGELLCIINWYNPFAWLLRNAIRQNLEFIADHQVLANGIDRKQYQYMLLKVTGMSFFSVANNFNLSSLKKRIVMMNKKTSASVHLLRFALIVPVLAVLLLAFRSVTRLDLPSPSGLIAEKVFADTTVEQEELITIVNGQLKARMKADKIIFDTTKPESKSGNIESIDIHKKNNRVTIRLKDGTVEKFDLGDPKQKAAFEKKYGKISTPPPPPPPPSVSGKPVPAPPAAPSSVPSPPAPPKPPVDNGEVVLVTDGPVDVKGAITVGSTSNPVMLQLKPDASVKETVSVTAVGYKADAKDIGVEPLIIVDGKIIPREEMNRIPPATIAQVNILKGNSATAIYGDKGKDGVILITTKAVSGTVTEQKKKNFFDDDLCLLNAIIIIDDKEMSCEQGNVFVKSNRNNIISVDIIKGADRVKEATGKNGPNAIIIKTKKLTD